jgi:integrase
MSSKNKRTYMYESLKTHKGIYQHKKTKMFQARKKIKGKQHTDSFRFLRDASHWKNTFSGIKAASLKLNTCPTLKEVWEAKQRLHFPSLAPSTRQVWLRRYLLLKNLEDYHMDEITPEIINDWIEKWLKFYKSDEWQRGGRGKHARYNLKNEINLFITIFNWMKEEPVFHKETSRLVSPILKRHKKMCIVKELPYKKKKIGLEDFLTFVSALDPIYQDLALIQYYTATRIGEASGIQIKNIDFDRKTLLIKDTCGWCQTNKTFIRLNPYPKTKEPKELYLRDDILEIVNRRLKLKNDKSDYLFQVNGKPLNYGTIQVNYRKAQSKTGIKYTGTHCLRHGMATLTRKVCGGSLDAVMAMTGHKDIKLAAHYSELDSEYQKEVSLKVMEHINEFKQSMDNQNDKNHPNVIPLFGNN